MTREPAAVDGRSDEVRAVLADVADVEGWMTDDQAERLFHAAVSAAAGSQIVEIGSYRGRSVIVLARAARPDVAVVAIDPHAGNDRGPRQWVGEAHEGEQDHELFHRNLDAAGVGARIRHVRKPSGDALEDVDGAIDVLYIDGAHDFRSARRDVRDWSARVPSGGRVLIHDAFSSVGVTLALLATTFFGPRLRYVGRSGSLVEFQVDLLDPSARAANACRQAAQLPWFGRNLLVKALIVLHLRRLARLLGHVSGPWPY